MIKSSPVEIDKDVSGLNWEVADFQGSMPFRVELDLSTHAA